MSTVKGLPQATLMYPEFHNEVERLLLEKRLTRKEACNLMGLERHAITHWESGKAEARDFRKVATGPVTRGGTVA